MFKAKRGSVPLPDTTVMAAALADIRAIQLKYDARLMWLVFLNRAVLVAQQLKALGMETDVSLDTMFESARQQAKQPAKEAPKTFNPDAAVEGKPS